MSSTAKPRVGVYKFASCDGCQLAFLNAGEQLLQLAELVEICHFAEAGIMDEQASVDIAFVEGSIITASDIERIEHIREHSRYLISIGACATAGGIQALRNIKDSDSWMADIYASPEFIDTLNTSTPLASHISVDLELWGCPVNGTQVMAAIRSLLFGVLPQQEHDKVCLQCKRNGSVCVMVTQGIPCMGPVTRTGCGAICPAVGRDCYACFGPADQANTDSLSKRFVGLGLLPEAISKRFHFITNDVDPFRQAGDQYCKDAQDS